MYLESYNLQVKNSFNKVRLFKENPIGFIISSMLAGIFVAFGVFVSFTIGSEFMDSGNQGLAKILMGLAFSVALSLVIFAGSELFTGNTMCIFMGLVKKEIRIRDGLLLLLVCYIGNLLGAILAAAMFYGTGAMSGKVGEFINNCYQVKVEFSWYNLLFRGILCNMLVCLAVWSTSRTKSDGAKLILIFLCILAFLGAGFEHSVANMSLLILPIFSNFNEINPLGYLYNLFFVTVGNIIGGVLFVGLPYFLISYKDKKENV